MPAALDTQMGSSIQVADVLLCHLAALGGGSHYGFDLEALSQKILNKSEHRVPLSHQEVGPLSVC